ncbi:hypothetical protein HWV62_34661 [Athelia sp. TMB]|nr:hypothetical protein HWV62_34661 [Athelia sp. TMB]
MALMTSLQWWTDYQPVSYTLTGKHGDRAQFASMVTTCHTAGVKVIVGMVVYVFTGHAANISPRTDTIFNHMTGSSSGTGTAGDSFTQYVYPGTYTATDFHYCGLEPNNDIVNYDNRLEVQTCQLDGLADLATNTTYVQQRLAEYANDLISLGVDGLRLDAAKHIAATPDLTTIKSLITGSPYITQEVIWGAGEPIQPSEYVGIGNVQEFRYTTALQNAFTNGSINSLENLSAQGWVAGTSANVFVANHDTERGGDSLNSNSPDNTYVTATIFSLGYPYGTPTVLSSYTFTSYDQGGPNGGTGVCSGTGGSDGWLCQHRWIAFSGMTGFHNNVGSAALTNWVSPQADRIAFERQALGFLAINNDNAAWVTTFTTTLPAGSYCDVITGSSVSGACTGTGFTVSGGSFAATVPARSAIAIHTGQKGTGSVTTSGTVAVTFNVVADTTYGENIYLTGSLTQLGSWATTTNIPLSSANYPTWSVTVNLPANTAFQYKMIRLETSGAWTWESDPNRSATTVASGTQTISDTWS